MKLFIALSLLLFGASQAFASPGCPDIHEVMDNTMFQSIPGVKGCMMTLSPRNPNDMTYRSFLFQDGGLFMIFNSLGNGPESTSSGAREFFLFPRNQEMSYRYNAATKRVNIHTPSGKVFVFNTEKTILVSISGTQFTTDYDVNANNKGGIEITKNNSFYLDAGFELGQSPTQNPKRKITFKDAQNNSCIVTNSEVFSYNDSLDVIFKYTDAQLKRFLARRCPKLKL